MGEGRQIYPEKIDKLVKTDKKVYILKVDVEYRDEDQKDGKASTKS